MSTSKIYDELVDLEPEGLIPLPKLSDEDLETFKRRLYLWYQDRALTYSDIQHIADGLGVDIELHDTVIRHKPPAVPPKPVVLDGGSMSDPMMVLGALLTAVGLAARIPNIATRLVQADRIRAKGDLAARVGTVTYAGRDVVVGSGGAITLKAAADKIRQIASTKAAKIAGNVAKGAIPTIATTAGIVALKQQYPELVAYIDSQLAQWQDVVKQLVEPTLERIDDLCKVMRMVPWVELAETWRTMRPAMDDMLKYVIHPYIDSVKDSQQWIPQYEQYLRDIGAHIDDMPSNVPPNLSPEQAAGLTQLLSLPVLGSRLQGQIRALQIQQYMHQHNVGYKTPLDAIAACAGMSSGAPSPGDIADIASDLPWWMLK